MKLKFDQEVQAVIAAIAALPSTATDEAAMKKPNELISEFDKKLTRTKTSKEFPMKVWAKQRRQLSFMWEFARLSTTKGVMQRFAMEQHALVVKVNPETPPPETEAEEVSKEVGYYALVKMFKDINSGELLKSPPFVRLAMGYGVIHLSDQEVQTLVDNNKV